VAAGRARALEFGRGGVGRERKRTNQKEWGEKRWERGWWSLACVVAAFYPEVWAPLEFT